MATGDNRVTLKLTDEADDKLDLLKQEGRLDRSDFADRAIKLYFKLLLEGKLPNDPYIEQERIERYEKMIDDTSTGGIGIKDKLFGDGED